MMMEASGGKHTCISDRAWYTEERGGTVDEYYLAKLWLSALGGPLFIVRDPYVDQ